MKRRTFLGALAGAATSLLPTVKATPPEPLAPIGQPDPVGGRLVLENVQTGSTVYVAPVTPAGEPGDPLYVATCGYATRGRIDVDLPPGFASDVVIRVRLADPDLNLWYKPWRHTVFVTAAAGHNVWIEQEADGIAT